MELLFHSNPAAANWHNTHHSNPGAANWHNTHAIYQNAICVAPPEDEQVMFETRRGP
jgi:hypothetical protein